MSKKKKLKGKQQYLPQQKVISHKEGISKTGWKIIFISVTTLVIGFILLKFTNSEGNNWASIISPIIILGSYIGIGIGILFPEKSKTITTSETKVNQ